MHPFRKAGAAALLALQMLAGCTAPGAAAPTIREEITVAARVEDVVSYLQKTFAAQATAEGQDEIPNSVLARTRIRKVLDDGLVVEGEVRQADNSWRRKLITINCTPSRQGVLVSATIKDRNGEVPADGRSLAVYRHMLASAALYYPEPAPPIAAPTGPLAQIQRHPLEITWEGRAGNLTGTLYTGSVVSLEVRLPGGAGTCRGRRNGSEPTRWVLNCPDGLSAGGTLTFDRKTGLPQGGKGADGLGAKISLRTTGESSPSPTRAELDTISRHLASYWLASPPNRDRSAEQVNLRLGLLPDGTVMGVGETDRPANPGREYQAQLEAAISAIWRASPLPIPREHALQFSDFHLRFWPNNRRPAPH